jgi:hypothetical protein
MNIMTKKGRQNKHTVCTVASGLEFRLVAFLQMFCDSLGKALTLLNSFLLDKKGYAVQRT